MKKTVHVVPHSHWDREWYFTTSRSKIYLMHDLEIVLTLLEQENGYDSFTLDGQASLLDDYLQWRPQDRERIKKAVISGTLVIGPWYTQSDLLVISGESIVRNFLYGIRICKEFGNYMNVGYVPDSFGQAASMPQIYRGFGMSDTLFWRGVSDDDVAQTEYTWRGEDGSVVNAYQIPTGYSIGGTIPEDGDLKEFLHKEPFKTTWGRSSTDQVYFPNGFDQAPARANIPELIERMNDLYKDEYKLKLSTIETYIQAIKDQNPKLEELSGELINGKLMRIHKTIFSSRSDLKQLNTQIQFYLVNTMEPILSIASLLGHEYPVETVRDIWKLMLENAAHDSIGSCVSDTTNEDVYMRYKQARDISMNLIELTLRKISTSITNKNNSKITLTLFNTLDQKRAGVVEAIVYIPSKEFTLYDGNNNAVDYTIIEMEDQTEYILKQEKLFRQNKQSYVPEHVYKAKLAIKTNEINSMGYAQYSVSLEGSSYKEMSKKTTNTLENEYYTIVIEKNGSLIITDKKSGHTYRNQGVLEENGDNGDSFNYSPPVSDFIVRSTEFTPSITVEESSLIAKASIAYTMKVPVDLEAREKKLQNADLPVEIIVTLKANDPTLNITVNVDNRAVDSHRLCALFDTEIASKFSIADQQFGVIERPVLFEKEMKLWNENKERWNEMPIAIETCQSFVALHNEQRGVAVFPKGVREYEIIGDSYTTIRLTLFRTYGFMGKTDLLYRPGRASGESVIATPNAQCHKKMAFDFAVHYFKGSIDKSNVANRAKEATTPIEVYQCADFLNNRLIFVLDNPKQTLATEFSLFTTIGDLTLSVFKKAEERDGYILRYYNGKQKGACSGTVQFTKPVTHVEIVDLKEEFLEKVSLIDNHVSLDNIGHAKFITLYVEFG